MNLFQISDFHLHSGEHSEWKIDCDALSDDDMAAVALMIANRLTTPFGSVYGIPRGGVRLARELANYASDGPVLIVDDVLTTGASMNKVRDRFNGRAFGAVIFARGPCPSWVRPLFMIRV